MAKTFSTTRPATRLTWTGLALAALIASGCNLDFITAVLNTLTTGNAAPQISVVQPLTTRNAAPGAAATIQWADTATVAGTFVTLKVERIDPATRDKISEIVLIPSRDALADGDSDKFDWDVSGIIVGNYSPVVRIESPDGQSQEKRAPGDFVITSALPVPTLTFTNPAATDVTIPAAGSATLTWTDNGVANASTLITLGLDTAGTTDRNSGDEIIIARDIPASNDGNNGSFVFNRVDADGAAVVAGTYILFARLVDGLHDNLGKPITVDAVGRLVLSP